MSEFKTAAAYIETVYGTRTFARALDCNDAMSIMDLMQDFSDYNLEKSHAPQMLEILKKIDYTLSVHGKVDAGTNLHIRLAELIQQATQLNREL